MTAVFGYLAIIDVRFGDVWAALRTSNYWWLLPALATLAVAIFLRAIRWRLMFVPETRPPLRPLTNAMLVGYLFNNILPARAGEVARIVALKQYAGTSRAETTGTVITERAYDVLSLLALLFALVPWLPEVTWLRAAGLLALLLIIGMLAAVVMFARFGHRPIRFSLRPLFRLRLVGEERGENVAVNLSQGFAGIQRLPLASIAFVLTTLSWAVTAVSFWLVMVAFDLQLSPVAGVLVVVAIGLAMILPSLPAAVGIFEGAVLVALSSYGVAKSQALSYALVAHALNFFPFLAAGGLALYVSSRRRERPVRRRGAYVRPAPASAGAVTEATTGSPASHDERAG